MRRLWQPPNGVCRSMRCAARDWQKRAMNSQVSEVLIVSSVITRTSGAATCNLKQQPRQEHKNYNAHNAQPIIEDHAIHLRRLLARLVLHPCLAIIVAS